MTKAYAATIIFVSACLIVPEQAYAISKCVAADGSVAYVQGNCPDLKQEREKIRIFDSDQHSYQPPAQEKSFEVHQFQSSKQIETEESQKPGRRNARHPCENEVSASRSQAKLDSKACRVLNRNHDPKNRACRTIASGDWQFEAKFTIRDYKSLIERCAVTQRPDF